MTNESKAEEIQKNMSDLSTETKEETKMETAQASTSTKRPPRKVTKAAPKKVAKKASKKSDADTIDLAALAKANKMEPRTARRLLRAAGLKTEGRWEWTKGSNDLKKAEAALSKKE